MSSVSESESMVSTLIKHTFSRFDKTLALEGVAGLAPPAAFVELAAATQQRFM
jgi:hypothetical protein